MYVKVRDIISKITYISVHKNNLLFKCSMIKYIKIIEKNRIVGYYLD